MSLKNKDELLSCSWSWCPLASIIGPGFSNTRVTDLHKANFEQYRDAWTRNRFLSANEAQVKFGLLERERGAWNGVISNVRGILRDLLQAQDYPLVGEWMAIYPDNLLPSPLLLYCTEKNFQLPLGIGIHTFPISVPAFEVSTHLAYLVEIPLQGRLVTTRYDERGDDALNEVVGCMRRVRVV